MNYRMRTLVIAALGFLLAFAVVPLASARGPESGSTASLSADVQSAGKAAAAKAALAPDTGRVLYAASLENDYVTVIVGDDGRFRMETTGGDPENPNDDYQRLLYGTGSPWSSYATIRIDGEDYIFGDSDPEETAGGMRDTFWTGAATVQVDQILTLVAGQYPGRNDTLRIEYRVTTLRASGAAPEVGVRVMLDTMLGYNDGAPFRVPGGAPVTSEVEYYGGDVPSYWRAFDSLDDPMVSAQGTVRAPAATTPDQLFLANWGGVYGASWDYSIDPGQTVTGDSAVCMYWNPQPVPVGGTRQVATHYGLGEPTPVSGAKPVVVLIGGINSETVDDNGVTNDAEWRGVWDALLAKGFDVTLAWTHKGGRNNYAIDSQSGDWDNCARELSRQIAKSTGTRPVILIGHSMGGLIARAYADNWKAPEARPLAIIQMGTPNYGSYAADFDHWLQGMLFDESTADAMLRSPYDMFAWDDLHKNPHHIPIYRIAGNYLPEPAKAEEARLNVLTWGKQKLCLKLTRDVYAGQANDGLVPVSSVRGGPDFDPDKYASFPAVHSPFLSAIWGKAARLLPRAGSESMQDDARSREKRVMDKIIEYVQLASTSSGGGVNGAGAHTWSTAKAAKALASAKQAASDIDAAPGWSICLGDSLSFAGDSASAAFVIEGTSALITTAVDVGEVSLQVRDADGRVVPCDTSAESNITWGAIDDVTPGVYTLRVVTSSGTPTQADVQIWDTGPSSLRILAPGRVEAGKRFAVQAAVYESSESSAALSFARNTRALSLDASIDGGAPVTLRDDGVAPDAAAGDGIYAASLSAPSGGSLASIAVAAAGKDAAGIEFSRQAPKSFAVAEPRATLSGASTYRLQTDASGNVTDLLVDVPVTPSQDCSVRVAADIGSGGALIAQSAAEAGLTAGENSTVTVSVPVDSLYAGLAQDGSFAVSRVVLIDNTDAMPTTLDEASGVISGSIPRADVAYSHCRASLIGPNPATSSGLVIRGDAVCTTEPISMVEYSLDEGLNWSEVPAPTDGWGGYDESWELTLSLEDGSYAIIFRARGASGPIAGAEGYVSFSVDTASPYGTFILAGGADTTLSPSLSADSTVGNLTAPIEMRFSHDFGTTWSTWGPFREHTTLTLPSGYGFKTVYAQYRDAEAAVLELDASIELLQPPDTAPPVTTASGHDAAWHSSPVTVTFSASDPAPDGSGVAYTEYRLDGGAWTRGTSCLVPAPADTKMTHAVDYRSADVAGNLEAYHTCTVNIDTTVPTPTPTVTLRLSGLTSGAVKLGKVVTASGTVTPTSLAGTRVTLTVQLKKGATWVRLKATTASISPAGNYRWKYTPTNKGTYRMRTTLPAGATTRWAGFKVR